MTRPPITSKDQMYAELAAGRLGNTTPQYFNAAEWWQSEDYRKYETWGVRTLTPGGPCGFYLHRRDVCHTVLSYANKGHKYNISPMVDAVTTVRMWMDVCVDECGLRVYGVQYPPRGGSWRKLMPTDGREYRGLAARLLLEHHLNPPSLDDVKELLELYPDHVVELSALDECIGIYPGRNYVCWEVRCSDGRYEADTWRRP